MENPKAVHRFLIALLAVCTVVALGLSIYYWDFYLFLAWLAIVVLFLVVCGVLALLNVAMIAPIFWLIGRFPDKRVKHKNQSSDEHVV